MSQGQQHGQGGGGIAPQYNQPQQGGQHPQQHGNKGGGGGQRSLYQRIIYLQLVANGIQSPFRLDEFWWVYPDQRTEPANRASHLVDPNTIKGWVVRETNGGLVPLEFASPDKQVQETIAWLNQAMDDTLLWLQGASDLSDALSRRKILLVDPKTKKPIANLNTFAPDMDEPQIDVHSPLSKLPKWFIIVSIVTMLLSLAGVLMELTSHAS